MLLVDDLPVCVVVDGRRAELAADLQRKLVHELVAHGFVHEHVVGRDACLTAIEELAPRDSPGGEPDLGRRIDDARTLAAEFEHGRRQVLGALFEHDLAHRLASREEHQVELLVEQLLVLFATAAHDRDVIGREQLFDELGHDLARGGRVSARLHDGGVAGGKRIHERLDREQERVVPRADDEHVSERRRLLVAARDVMSKRRARATTPGESSDVLQHVGDLAEHQPYFAHVTLGRALAQIGAQRVANLPFARHDDLAQGLERADARLDVDRRAGGEQFLLVSHQLLNVSVHRLPPPVTFSVRHDLSHSAVAGASE